jgi:hypothetical protein
LLGPTLKEVGIGYYQSGEWACAIDCLSGTTNKAGKDIVFFPEDKQENVPLLFGFEMPSPIPSGHKGDAGFPITITFAQRQKVAKVEVKVSGPNEADVPVYVSTPESPATSFTQHNTVCVIPRQPLAKATTYQVTLRCDVSGKPYTRTWRFTTEK